MYRLVIILPDGRCWEQTGVAYSLPDLNRVWNASRPALQAKFGKGTRAEYIPAWPARKELVN